MAFKLNSINSEVMLPIEGGSSQAITLDSLPLELLRKIFYHLSAKDLQTIAPLNRKIFSVVIDSANRNEPLKIKKFISALFQLSPRWLNQVPEQPETALKEISQNVTTQNFESLRLLKGYNLNVKTQLINVMKTLNTETLTYLEQRLHLPCFFENIYILIQVEKLKIEANLLPDGPEKYRLRDVISQPLAKALAMDGNIPRAIEIAASIFSTSSRAAALKDVFTVFVQAGEAGRMDRFLEVVRSISREKVKYITLGFISEAVATAGDIDQAFEIAGSISDHEYRMSTFKYIFAAMVQRGNIDRALQIANSIADDHSKGAALTDIASACIRFRNIDRALDIANLIADDYSRGAMLKAIASACMQSDNFDRAHLEIAGSISDHEYRRSVFKYIFKAMAQRGNIDRAFEMANSIADHEDRRSVFKYIFVAMVKPDNIERAFEIANLIADDHSRRAALTDIAIAYNLLGNSARALQIASLIGDEPLMLLLR